MTRCLALPATVTEVFGNIQASFEAKISIDSAKRVVFWAALLLNLVGEEGNAVKISIATRAGDIWTLNDREKAVSTEGQGFGASQ